MRLTEEERPPISTEIDPKDPTLVTAKEERIPLYERMRAKLDAPSFEYNDRDWVWENVSNRADWIWNIKPKEGSIGPQVLTVYLSGPENSGYRNIKFLMIVTVSQTTILTPALGAEKPKTASSCPQRVGVEVPFTCEFAVSNDTSNTVFRSVRLEVTLPPYITYKDSSPSASHPSDLKVVWSIGDLGPREPPKKFSLTVVSRTIPQDGRINISGEAIFSDAVPLLVGTQIGGFGLSTSLDSEPKPAMVNQAITYTLILQQKGLFKVDNVNVSIVLPASFTFVDSDSTPAGFKAKAEAGNTLTFNSIPSISEKSSMKLTFVVMPNSRGDHVVTAKVKHDGFTPGISTQDGIKVVGGAP